MREGQAAEFLGKELENIVLSGMKITLAPWPDGKGWEFADAHYDDTEASQGTGGSNNWPVEAWGCRYSVNFRERGWDREKESREFFAKAGYVFGGKELDSVHYTYMQGHAVLEVAHVSRHIGAGQTHASAMRWLEYLACRCEITRSQRTGRIVTCGDRSADSLAPGELSWQDRFADLGMSRRAAPKFEKILNARADLVRMAFARLRGGRSPLDIMRELGFRTLVPLRVVESQRGKWVFRVGSGWHGSTQPVAMGQELNGVESFAPTNRGYREDPADRTNRRPGVPTVTESAESVRYDSPVYASPIVMALPPRGERLIDVEIGGPEIVRDLRGSAPAPGPNPTPPTPPAPPVTPPIPNPVPPPVPGAGDLVYLGAGGLPGELLVGSRDPSTSARLRPIHGDVAGGWPKRWVVEELT